MGAEQVSRKPDVRTRQFDGDVVLNSYARLAQAQLRLWPTRQKKTRLVHREINCSAAFICHPATKHCAIFIFGIILLTSDLFEGVFTGRKYCCADTFGLFASRHVEITF